MDIAGRLKEFSARVLPSKTRNPLKFPDFIKENDIFRNSMIFTIFSFFYNKKYI